MAGESFESPLGSDFEDLGEDGASSNDAGLLQSDDWQSSATTESQWLLVDEVDEEDGPASDLEGAESDLEGESCSPAREEEPQHCRAAPSARLLTCSPLEVGSDLLVVQEGSCGRDLTQLCSPALEAFPDVSCARCIGHVASKGRVTKVVPASLAQLVEHLTEGPQDTASNVFPAVARAIVRNDGQEAWPEETALHLVLGESFGFGMLHIGALLPGHAAEIHLDLGLTAGPSAQCGGRRSAWVLADQHGEPFGPLLVLEVAF
ncbi:unnamed protein product [Polarella glacialis]|uniref:Uncharacterized protein n=1 Tax=Polarella glacialis TaxID=89957 RepID=A0A813DV10_POLGL|nr:unnamed protein product [Polarella glacialis]